MINNVYIISYFGDRNKQKLREKRVEVHKKQIDWIQTNLPKLKINIVAQDYDENEYLPNINYIKETVLGHPSKARNILLNLFYKSNDDFGLFLDNDSIIDNHGVGISIIDLLNQDVKKFSNVDLFQPLNPAMQGFNSLYSQDRYKENLVFTRDLRIKASVFFLKNLVKHYGLELYMDSEMRMSEDFEFAHLLISKGCTTFKLENIVLKELASNDSTLNLTEKTDKEWGSREGERKIEAKYWDEIVFNRYAEYGLKLNKDGSFNRNEFYKRYWPLPESYLEIKR